MARFQDWWNKNIWSTQTKSADFSTISGAFWSDILNFENFSQEKISEKRAHAIATAFTCINVRSQTICALPINIFQESKGKKENLTDHPAYYPLAQQPNNYTSSANLFLTSMIHADSWGNSIIGINRNRLGQPTSFDIIEPGDYSFDKIDGEAYYKIRGEMYTSRDVLHFRWFSYDGLCGVSPIRLHANTFGAAIKQDRYSITALGQKPPGIITYEGNLTPEQRQQNKEAWQKDLADGKTPVLGGGMKFQPIMLPADDAAYIESRKMTKTDIYAIYRVPPTFAQDFEKATFSNAEQQDLVFVKHTITPLVRVMEQEMNMKLFTEKEKKNTFVKFNLNGLLRGDLAARKEFYQSMVNTGVMNRNEARSLEDLNSYEGGDDYLVQGAMVPADLLRQKYEKELLSTVGSTEPFQPKTEKNGYHYNTN